MVVVALLVSANLLAPPAAMLSDVPIGDDPRPKAIVVPELDQFSPPAAMAHAVAGWEATTVTTLANTDHFLGASQPIVDSALNWIEQLTSCDTAARGEE